MEWKRPNLGTQNFTVAATNSTMGVFNPAIMQQFNPVSFFKQPEINFKEYEKIDEDGEVE